MNMIDIQRKVESLLADYKKDFEPITSPPVPVEDIAKWRGIRLVYRPLNRELSGMIFIREGTPIVGINSLHHPNRQRFTIAHELAHFELHRDAIDDQVHVDKKFPVLMRSSSSASGTDRIEIDANLFAAELLMPMSLLNPLLGRYDIDDEGPLLRLSRMFRVSRQALEYRIRQSGQ